MIDVYKENLRLEAKGEVQKIDFYKGGGTVLFIKDSLGNKIDIAGGKIFYENVRRGDNFTKIRNSNKCIVERNDSIIYIDCYMIEEKYRDSLGQIAEWPESIKGRWEIKN